MSSHSTRGGGNRKSANRTAAVVTKQPVQVHSQVHTHLCVTTNVQPDSANRPRGWVGGGGGGGVVVVGWGGGSSEAVTAVFEHASVSAVFHIQ
jgi:hypothetical protein